VSADTWSHKYSRSQAAYPVHGLRERKFWPSVSRIDNPYGDRNLVCACPAIEEYQES
jgi:glycine dehydrogenase